MTKEVARKLNILFNQQLEDKDVYTPPHQEIADTHKELCQLFNERIQWAYSKRVAIMRAYSQTVYHYKRKSSSLMDDIKSNKIIHMNSYYKQKSVS